MRTLPRVCTQRWGALPPRYPPGADPGEVPIAEAVGLLSLIVFVPASPRAGSQICQRRMNTARSRRIHARVVAPHGQSKRARGRRRGGERAGFPGGAVPRLIASPWSPCCSSSTRCRRRDRRSLPSHHTPCPRPACALRAKAGTEVRKAVLVRGMVCGDPSTRAGRGECPEHTYRGASVCPCAQFQTGCAFPCCWLAGSLRHRGNVLSRGCRCRTRSASDVFCVV